MKVRLFGLLISSLFDKLLEKHCLDFHFMSSSRCWKHLKAQKHFQFSFTLFCESFVRYVILAPITYVAWMTLWTGTGSRSKAAQLRIISRQVSQCWDFLGRQDDSLPQEQTGVPYMQTVATCCHLWQTSRAVSLSFQSRYAKIFSKTSAGRWTSFTSETLLTFTFLDFFLFMVASFFACFFVDNQ